MENNTLSACSAAVDKANAKIKNFIGEILDGESFVETDVFLTGKGFDSALEALGEGVVTGYGTIGGTPVHLFAQSADVFKGSFSEAQAQKIRKSMRRAAASGTPFLSVIDSCGARIGAGAGIMEAYASVIAESVELADEVPHVCIVKGFAVGMTATFAAGADFVFMGGDAVMSVNSPAYLLSDKDSVSADYKSILGYKAYAGSGDAVQFTFKSAKDLKTQLQKLLSVLLPEEGESTDDPNRQEVKMGQAIGARERIALVCDKNSVIDYCAEYAPELQCALAKINGISVGVVATESGYLSEAALEKCAGFVEKLDGYDLPLVTLVDTLGVNPTSEQEAAGIAKKTFALMKTIKRAHVAKIGVAVGAAVGFGYSALMSKALGFGYTLAAAGAVVAAVPSEAGIFTYMNAQIKDKGLSAKLTEKLKKQYEETVADPLVAAKEGYLDNVVEASAIRPYVASALMMLLGI